jgi:NAD-dependent deacetylase
MKKEKWVIFTGAGVSEESGIPTFRSSDENSIWVKYNADIVCNIRSWAKHKDEMLEFGNEIRREISKCEPNKCHYDIAKLETAYDVTVNTTNVDDLHERAGSSKVIHIHGDLTELMDINLQGHYKSDQDIKIGDLHPETGEQLRHNIVMFGEMPNNLEEAAKEIDQADWFMVIGTSLSVYPAAGLVLNHGKSCQNKYYFDPEGTKIDGFKTISVKATEVFEVVNYLNK